MFGFSYAPPHRRFRSQARALFTLSRVNKVRLRAGSSQHRSTVIAPLRSAQNDRLRWGESVFSINGSSWAPTPTEYGGIFKFICRAGACSSRKNKREGRPLPYRYDGNLHQTVGDGLAPLENKRSRQTIPPSRSACHLPLHKGGVGSASSHTEYGEILKFARRGGVSPTAPQLQIATKSSTYLKIHKP